MSRLLCLVAGTLFAAAGCGKEKQDTPFPEEGVPTVNLSSSAFKEGETIPKQHTADGQDVSPPLAWSGEPAGVKSYALICDDPDAPRDIWVHWVLFNIPADRHDLPEAVPAEKTAVGGARQGTNDFRKLGYGGPSPPAGKPHRYFFKLYALDANVDLDAGATKQQLLDAMKNHKVLAEGKLMGKYGR